MDGARLIDSHLHLIHPEQLHYDWLDDRLAHRFAGEELARAVADSAAAADCAFVFVQAECAPAQSLAEVDWVALLATALPVRGIVARAALEEGAAVGAHLEELRARPLVVGVRRLLQSEAPGFAAQPGFLAGARAAAAAGLTFDACVRPQQLPEVGALADAVPDLPIALDHLGKPAVGSAAGPLRPAPEWRRDLRALAARPNVVAKVSGLPAEARGEWSSAQLRPFFDAALEAFGAHRLMFGGDAPVSWPLGRWMDAVIDWTRALSAPESDAILRGNAARFYGIEES